jgi:hypothetical protein
MIMSDDGMLYNYKCSKCAGIPCEISGVHHIRKPDGCPLKGNSPNWKQVEAEQPKGDIMHVPVIHEKGEAEEKKWEYRARVYMDYFELDAVDSKTGEHVAAILQITPQGTLTICHNANGKLQKDGYEGQELQFDEEGRIKVQ